VAAAGSMLGFLLVLALELLDTTIRTRAELELKLGIPVLGLLPHEPRAVEREIGRADSSLIEKFRMLARTVRRLAPDRGARILVTSAMHGEGTTLVAANLALCLGRRDERVLLVCTEVRPEHDRSELRGLIFADDSPEQGLGEYLSYQVDEIDDVLWPTVLPGVECLPRVGEAVIPEMLASNRMKELLDELSKRYTVILLDAPPLMPYVDALAERCDAALLVVRSRTCTVATLRKAVKKLETASAQIVGAVLNDVRAVYMDRDEI